MYRWRCLHRACARSRSAKRGGRAQARQSTKRKIPPTCRTCGRLMTLDRYRTSRRESRKDNCSCGVWPWSARGGPHNRRSCQSKLRREFEDSQHELPLRDEEGRFMDDGVPF